MNTRLCPCCGQSNRCAQADSETAVEQCWCFSVEVDRQALDELPLETRDRACLCPRCAQGLRPETAD
ncbi:cysteine-rich CWC family protein [Phytopseudomonas dryadis]|uniref:Cysteine-rich CWC n=1 Tax=Phytopseudomonas dryadis TaxID=2487520 RepID=A0ABY1Z2P6_9GAMM|nr:MULTISPECIES: cysteine-rich CWC family protein [Pseudomonas]TBV01388.1 hypothetical protein DNK34_21380 [Pseudomonas dryadis]TBV14142.1 hypothetical protein DNK41_20975 [Pseudomonas sp. FRB 230]